MNGKDRKKINETAKEMWDICVDASIKNLSDEITGVKWFARKDDFIAVLTKFYEDAVGGEEK